MSEYGYIRVSSKEQNEERQRIAMREYGILDENIFFDRQSGKNFQRAEYRNLFCKLKQGDVLVVKSIDRLGRNYEEIQNQWRRITREKGVAIVVLDMPLLNTSHQRDLTQTLISDIVLQLLSYVAQTEREMIRQRQAEGIAAAKARGVRFGNRAKERTKEYERLKKEYLEGRISCRAAAKSLGISHTTFWRWCDQKNVN